MPVMRQLDPSLLPRPEQYAAVAEWKYNPKGLIAFGGFGLAKTRALCAVSARLRREGYSVVFIRGVDFQSDVTERTRPGGIGGFNDWMDELVEADVVAFDDLDKTKFSDRTLAETFNLLDRRCHSFKPMLFTANSSSQQLLEKLSSTSQQSTAGAIVRRIKEFCIAVNFNTIRPITEAKP